MEVDQSLAIEQLLAKQRDEHTPPELQPYFLQFQEFWERRLWHQLTECLVQYFDEAPEGPQRLFLFKNFVLTFADKINQLQLVSLALSAASQIQGVLSSSFHLYFYGTCRWKRG
jgi:26S proteasome regulatory subunit N9